MDRSWMNASHMSPAYENVVQQFLKFALERSRSVEDERYLYPCIKCLSGRRQVIDNIREHLLYDWIKNYITW